MYIHLCFWLVWLKIYPKIFFQIINFCFIAFFYFLLIISLLLFTLGLFCPLSILYSSLGCWFEIFVPSNINIESSKFSLSTDLSAYHKFYMVSLQFLSIQNVFWISSLIHIILIDVLQKLYVYRKIERKIKDFPNLLATVSPLINTYIGVTIVEPVDTLLLTKVHCLY